MTDVMIDIETLGLRSGCVILSIAGIKFDRTDNLPKLDNMDTFYQRIDIDTAISYGLIVDSDTVNWWNKQSKEAHYEAIENPDRYDLKLVLNNLSQWFKGSKYVWSHGASFDIPIVDYAYFKCGLKLPWNYYNYRDTRTIFDLGKIRNSDLPQDNKHHPLYDCYRQIVGVKKGLKTIYEQSTLNV